MTNPTRAEILEMLERIDSAHTLFGDLVLKMEGSKTAPCGVCQTEETHKSVFIPTYFFHNRPHKKFEPTKAIVQIGFNVMTLT